MPPVGFNVERKHAGCDQRRPRAGKFGAQTIHRAGSDSGHPDLQQDESQEPDTQRLTRRDDDDVANVRGLAFDERPTIEQAGRPVQVNYRVAAHEWAGKRQQHEVDGREEEKGL